MNVLNRHHIRSKWPPFSIYIGRGTAFGNRFVVGKHGARDECIDAFEHDLRRRIAEKDPVILTAFAGLDDRTNLVCSCKPLPCHGDVIVKVWQELYCHSKVFAPQHLSRCYTGIGSRSTPPKVQKTIERVAARLEELGYTLRSGGADGADSAFEAGCSKKQIFLPWPGFNGRKSEFQGVTGEALLLASVLHPKFGRLSESAQKLMARNGFQVLGPDLRTPSDFVVCWTPDGVETEAERSYKTGGTGQAIALADRWGIPVFNMARPDALHRLAERLRELSAFREASPPMRQALSYPQNLWITEH